MSRQVCYRIGWLTPPSFLPGNSMSTLCKAGLLSLLALICRLVTAADPLAETTSPPKPVTMSTKEDHQNMLSQLGITKLRPGPNGNEAAPNHANYDEEKANPFPKLPEALALRDGTSVKTADDWWSKRRPEIVEDFEREVYGRIPKNVPKVTWSV